ncbi:hypothetical protein [Kitasatospora sp. NPDC004272]
MICPDNFVYWRADLDRTPDWDKWLRPHAWCTTCQRWVRAVQVFKKPGADMGRYRQQYVYRCPHTTCRHQAVEPPVLPAASIIDWALPGQRIGDRIKPLATKTLARIEAGLRRYAAGNRDSTSTAAADGPPQPQNPTWTPFIAELRGGSSDARPVLEALATVTASGNHHGLVASPAHAAMIMRNNGSTGDGAEHCTPATQPLRTLTTAGHQSLVTWPVLVPYYGTGTARPVAEPVGTMTTRDRYALAAGRAVVDVDDVLFRMLEPHEIGAAMAFRPDYVVVGNKREKVRQFGNAVTSNVAELLVSALVETITGQELATGWAR